MNFVYGQFIYGLYDADATRLPRRRRRCELAIIILLAYVSLLQRFVDGVNARDEATEDQAGGKGDAGEFPAPGHSASPHSVAASSSSAALEVEDCEDLEVAGNDSNTNLVVDGGSTWNDGMADHADTYGKLFTEIRRSKEILAARFERDNEEGEESDSEEGGDGKPQITAKNPTPVAEFDSSRSTEPTGRGELDRDGFDSGDHKDDDDNGLLSRDEPELSFYQTGDLDLGKIGRPANSSTVAAAAADDFDFDDEDEEDENAGMIAKPTFSPFSALSVASAAAAAGGNDHHPRVANDAAFLANDAAAVAENVAVESKNDVSLFYEDSNQHPTSVAAAAAESGFGSSSKDRSFYGISSDDEKASNETEDDEEADDDDDDDDHEDNKNETDIPSTAASNLFDDFSLAGSNPDSQRLAVDRDRVALESSRSGGMGESILRSELYDVEELDETPANPWGMDSQQLTRINDVASTFDQHPPQSADGGHLKHQVLHQLDDTAADADDKNGANMTDNILPQPARHEPGRKEAEDKV